MQVKRSDQHAAFCKIELEKRKAFKWQHTPLGDIRKKWKKSLNRGLLYITGIKFLMPQIATTKLRLIKKPYKMLWTSTSPRKLTPGNQWWSL